MGVIPVVIDPEGKLIQTMKPNILVDAILAKKNLGTNRRNGTDYNSLRSWILCR